MRVFAFALALAAPLAAFADPAEIVNAAVEEHVLPGFERLADRADRLSEAATADCAPTSWSLRAAYADAFDAWIEVSHLRFGPTEAENRAFALAFWPDPRGKTPKALAQLIRDEDAAVNDAAAFRSVSVAARGFYAMERLLYGAPEGADAAYLCALTVAVARDIAAASRDIQVDWTNRYAALTRAPFAADGPYRSEDDVLRALYTALTTGLQFTSELRLGRPLGTLERPRPRRAEARLSGRPLRHVELSLASTRALAEGLAADAPGAAERLAVAFDAAMAAAARIDDPVFAVVETPQGRIRVEALQQRVDGIRAVLAQDLGPALGVSEGFNALDGD